MKRIVRGKSGFIRINWYLFALVFIVISFTLIFFRKTTPKPPKIKPSSSPEFVFEVKNESYSAKIGASGSPKPLVSFTSKAGGNIAFQMDGLPDSSMAQKDGKVSFLNVSNGTDVTYTPLTNGIKEEIIINQPTSIAEYNFDIVTSNAAPQKTLENNYSRYFYDSSGRYQFHIEKPYAVDSLGQRNDNLTMQIRQSKDDENKYQILIAVPVDWLNSPDRSYPISIDPTFLYDTSAEFVIGTYNRLADTGSVNAPSLETYYQELPADRYTVGLWHMNEATGTTNIADSSGNVYTALSASSTNVGTGILGNARTFNGSSDSISLVSATVADIVGDITFESWINPTSFSSSNVVHKDYQFAISIDSTGAVAWADSSNWSFANFGYTNIGLVTGSWQHLAVTKSGNVVKIYLNGKEKVSKIFGKPITSTGNILRLGCYANATICTSSYFVGSMDEIRISNIARSAEEIKSSAQRRPYGVFTSDVIDFGDNVVTWNPLTWSEPGVYTGDGETLSSTTSLVAKWNFNDTTGTTATNNAGTCGATCNGTLTNFASTTSQDQAPGTGWTSQDKRWGAGALNFDGTNDTVSLGAGSEPTFDFERTSPISISAWVKTTNGLQQAIFSKQDNVSPNSGFELHMRNTGALRFNFFSNTSGALQVETGLGSRINDGNWHYVVSTYDGTSLPTGVKIYIDGISQSLATVTNTLTTSALNNITAHIGSRNNLANYFNGSIDSLAIFGRVLTSSEVLSNFQAGNIELQTRVGSTATPNDGTWDAWLPVASETSINTFDSDSANWLSTSPNIFTSNQSVIKQEGAGSLLLNNKLLPPSSTNLASGKTYTKSVTPHASYPDTNNTELTDGLLTTGWADGRSVGYYAVDSSVTLDLTTAQTIGQVAGYFGSGTTAGVYYPLIAKVYTSTDNVTFTYKNNLYCNLNTTNETAGWCYTNIPLTTARYIRIDTSSLNWTMWSEIKVSSGDMFAVGNWKLDETGGTGAYIKDSTSNALHGTPTGTTAVSGLSGMSRNFNGTTDFIDMGDIASVDTATALSGCAWIKSSAVTTDNVIIAKNNLANDGLIFFRDEVGAISGRTDVFTIYVADSVDADSARVESVTNASVLGKWTHACFSYQALSATGLHLYINGKEDPNSPVSTASIGAIDSTTNPFRIGSQSVSNAYFAGTIDEVVLWNKVALPEEIAENYRLGSNQFLNKTISSTDLSAKTSLPFYVAADRPGSYLVATVGEGAYANYQPDANTKGLWHFDENSLENDGILKYTTTNTTEANSFSYHKTLSGQSIVMATSDTIEYDVYIDTNITTLGNMDPTFTDATALRNFASCHAGNQTAAYLNWIHVICTIPSTVNGKTLSWIDLVDETDTSATKTAYYDNFVVKNSAGIIKAVLWKGGATDFNVLNTESNAANTQSLSVTSANAEGIVANDGQLTRYSITDSSSNANHGIPTGSASVPGYLGNGRSFNGISNYIDIPNSTAFDSTSYTIETWAYSSNFTQNGFVFEKGPVNTQYSLFFTAGNIVQRGHNSAGTICLDVYTTLADAGINNNAWNHIVSTYDGSNQKLYVNGKLRKTVGIACTLRTGQVGQRIGAYGGTTPLYFFNGTLDEVRVSNIARTAEEIRQAYEIGSRTHPITIDFAAKLDAANLIVGTGDLGFRIDARPFGLQNKGGGIYPGDKIIVKENYDGVEYISQGTVGAVTVSTGLINLIAWDAGSTVPVGGFTANADVFKWQREYWNITGPMDSHLNAVTNLTLRLTDGLEGRNIWIDDLRSTSGYLTTPAGSAIQSATGKQYIQYRGILNSSDRNVSGSLSNVSISANINKPEAPTGLTATALSSTSIRWDYTDNSNNETGFKLYASDGTTLISTNAVIGSTSITETGLIPNTSYSRRIVAYNAYGNSLMTPTTTKYTLANLPGASTVTRALTSAVITINSNSNPTTTQYAIYTEANSTCDGSGGYYLNASGVTNADTPLWQPYTSWGTGGNLTVSNLNPEAIYSFCLRASNGDSVLTSFGPTSIIGDKIVPVVGDLDITTNVSSILSRYRDGSDSLRYIIGLDNVGTASTNSSQLRMLNGSTLAINSTDTLVVGNLILGSGSIQISNGAKISIGGKPWTIDRDGDGYPATSSGEIKLWFGDVAPANAGVPQAYFKRKGAMSTLNSVDCDDNAFSATNTCCANYNFYLDADGDTYGSSTIGGFCQVSPTPPQGYVSNNTDCNDTVSGHNNTLPSNYYPDADIDSYTVNMVSAGTAVCSSATTWQGSTAISSPGNATVTNITLNSRKTSANGLDCDDTQSLVYFSHTACYWDYDFDTYTNGNVSGKTCLNSASCNTATRGSLGGGVVPTATTAGYFRDSSSASADCGPNTATAYPGSTACGTVTFLNASGTPSYDYNCSTNGGTGTACAPVYNYSASGYTTYYTQITGSCNSCNKGCSTDPNTVYSTATIACGSIGATCTSFNGLTGGSCSHPVGDMCAVRPECSDYVGSSPTGGLCNGVSTGTQSCN